MKARAAELFGTFALVFAGTGAIVIDGVSGGAVTHVGIALTFGLVVAAMIYALGNVSGAHFNPAVTIAFWAARRFPGREVGPYVLSQCAGALLASLALWAMFPAAVGLGATSPLGDPLQAAALEFVITLVLMFVILSVSQGAKETGMVAGAAIGATVGLAALFAGPISGASMNPARSLAPALVSGDARALGSLWVYLVAPVFGAAAAVPLCRLVQPAGCCEDGAGCAVRSADPAGA